MSHPRTAVPEDRTLEPDAATIRRWLALVTDQIIAHVESLPNQPAGYDLASDAVRERHEPLPERGRDLAPILDFLFGRGVATSFNAAGPGYMAYIPGGGLVHSAIADLIAGVINRYVGVWVAAPLLVQIEANVIRWFCDMLGFPASARGLLTSGGSIANLTAIVTARWERLGEQFLDGTCYVSRETHHSIAKAARIAGLPAAALVEVPTDERYRMVPNELARLIRRDREQGRRPFLVVANAGSTNTGAIDELDHIAELSADEGLWLHVDAAYGGFFMLTEPGRQAMAGIERADSVTLDPHKGLFLPYGTGALCVRDGSALRRAHGTHAHYMPAMQEDDDAEPRPDFCEYGPELSRDFRGLRVWLPIALHGIGPFRANLDEKLALARLAEERLREMPEFEVVASSPLSIVAFRLAPRDRTDAELDELNEALLARILAHQRVWLTSTRLRGRFAIRICVLSFRTHRDRVEEALDIIRDEGAGLLARSGGETG